MVYLCPRVKNYTCCMYIMELVKFTEHADILQKITEREDSEKIAVASTTSTFLQKLGLSLASLPAKHRALVRSAAEYQTRMGISTLDPAVFTLRHTETALRRMDDEYEILQLRQKDEVLDRQIQKSKEEIRDLRLRLEDARKELHSHEPGPENVASEIHVVRQKVASYEQSCDKNKAKFSALRVPPELHPSSLETLVERLETLRREEVALKEKADHILLARDAKQKLLQLKAAKY